MKLSSLKNQQGVLSFYLLIAGVGIMAFFLLVFVGPFKNSLFTALYPKPTSEASQNKEQKFEQDVVLIKFKDGVTDTEENEILKENQAERKDEIKQIKVKAIRVSSGKVLEKIEKLKKNPKVEYAEVNGIAEAEFIPNDPNFSSQWSLSKISAQTAWDSADGTGIVMAVADTGVDPSHPDLVANLVPGWNFYDNNADTRDIQGHGTAVAGVAGAVLNNTTQIAGVAGKAKIMPLRIAYKDADGKAYASWFNMSKAITYAADNGAKIVNVSYQGSTGNSTVRNAADYMFNKGGLTVFCESNTGVDSGLSDYPRIINVSATDTSDMKTSFSTFGNDVDVAAPGQGILSTNNGGAIGNWSGTSFSAPMAMGVLALIWQVNPNLTPDQVQNILFQSSDDLGTTGKDIYYGWGRINAARAVTLAKGQPLPSLTPQPTASPAPSSTPVPSASNDSIPPTVTLSAPLNGSIVQRNTSLQILATASDNIAVAKVEFYIDGGLKYTDTTPAYSYTGKIGGKPGASHTITVKAYDNANNSSSASIKITAN